MFWSERLEIRKNHRTECAEVTVELKLEETIWAVERAAAFV
jgi:hypothetical protein